MYIRNPVQDHLMYQVIHQVQSSIYSFIIIFMKKIDIYLIYIENKLVFPNLI